MGEKREIKWTMLDECPPVPPLLHPLLQLPPGTRSADLCRIRPLFCREKRAATGSRSARHGKGKENHGLLSRDAPREGRSNRLARGVPRRSGTLIIDTCSTRCPVCDCDRYRAKGNAPNSPRLADIRRFYPARIVEKRRGRRQEER